MAADPVKVFAPPPGSTEPTQLKNPTFTHLERKPGPEVLMLTQFNHLRVGG